MREPRLIGTLYCKQLVPNDFERECRAVAVLMVGSRCVVMLTSGAICSCSEPTCEHVAAAYDYLNLEPPPPVHPCLRGRPNLSEAA